MAFVGAVEVLNIPCTPSTFPALLACRGQWRSLHSFNIAKELGYEYAAWLDDDYLFLYPRSPV